MLRAFAPHQDDHAQRAADSRAAPSRSGSAKSSGWRATPGSSPTRRSELPIDAEPRADVVVLDTIGELAQLYQLATAVFVGGSLADHGGHNILEPAIFGKPIVFGPHMQNFKEIADAFLTNDAAIQVHSDRELDDALLTLVTDPVRPRAARRGGARAGRSQPRRERQDAGGHRRPAAAGDGTAARLSGPSDWCIDPLSVLSSVYGAAAAWRRAHGTRAIRRGGAAGAAGRQRRQPARRRQRQDAGRRAPRAAACWSRANVPAILTRGYGRRIARRWRHVVSDGMQVHRGSRVAPATSR